MIGDMRHRITLMNPKKIPNGRGGWTNDYTTGDRMEIWAAAKYLSIRQRAAYMEWGERADIRFLIRENPFIGTDTQIAFDGATFLIVERLPDKKNPHLVGVMAREV